MPQTTFNEETLTQTVAKMLLEQFGFVSQGQFYVGTLFLFLQFSDNTGQPYSLEYGTVDEPLTVNVYRGSIYDHIYNDGSEPEQVWTLSLEDTDTAHLGLCNFEGPKHWTPLNNFAQNAMWAIGALTLFLYDFKEGKFNG